MKTNRMSNEENTLLSVAQLESAIEKQMQRRPSAFMQLLNFAGGVSGIMAVITIIAYGGQMYRQMQIDTRRIDSIEASGSPLVREQVKTLMNEADARRVADASLNDKVNDLKLDYGQRIAGIGRLLEKITEQQTQLVTLIKVQNQISNK